MKTTDGFDQCYNGQAAVNDDMIIVGAYSNAHGNDKQELISAIDSVPTELGKIENAVADNGYFSEDNIKDCAKRKIAPIISTSREKHNSYLNDILTKNEEQANEANTPTQKMNKILKSKKGKDIAYNLKRFFNLSMG